MENKSKCKCIAVIDLGTNTFHLVIADCTVNGWTILHKEKNYVRLGSEGLGHISLNASQRAESTLKDFALTISKFKVDEVLAFGTAAIRSANNQSEFVNEMSSKTGINISVIDGSKEAQFIHKGVISEDSSRDDNFMIMDIGGGSIEYIHSYLGEAIWFESYNTGIAEIYKLFPPEDRVSNNTIDKINQFLTSRMTNMSTYWANPNSKTPHILYGASGSFEVLFEMLTILQISENSTVITAAQFNTIYEFIIPTNSKERLNMQFIPTQRKELIVIALIIIKYVMERYEFEEIKYASYALKEGVLATKCLELQS